jgi:hypothetical protein
VLDLLLSFTQIRLDFWFEGVCAAPFAPCSQNVDFWTVHYYGRTHACSIGVLVSIRRVYRQTYLFWLTPLPDHRFLRFERVIITSIMFGSFLDIVSKADGQRDVGGTGTLLRL